MKYLITSLAFLIVFSFGVNVASADSYDVVGPKGTQYIGDGEIYLTWNRNKVVDYITLQDYKENDLFVTHAWKVRSDEPILDGYYNLSDHYEDWTLQEYMKNGGKYRLHLTGPDGVDFYSDWFIAIWGESQGGGDQKISASITSISDSPSPFIDGKAYNTEKIGVGIITKGGKDVYGGWVDVEKDDYWFLKVPGDLSNGDYEVYLYLDNKEYDREDFEITSSNVSYSKNLKLSVEPDKIYKEEELIIRFNDIGADYYIVSASCKDGVSVGGKARSDLCVEGEKIYPTGKDVLRVEDFYPSTDRSTSFLIEVSAFENGRVTETDGETVEVYAKNKVDDDSDKSNTEPNNDENKDVNLSKTQILDLLANLFGKDSDAYKIISLLISLGIIK